MNEMVLPEAFAPTATEEIATERKVEGQLVYAIGDIHGRYDLLKALLGEIWRDCRARAAGRVPVLIFCGDYIDRGPHSAHVLDSLNWLGRRTDIRLHLLKGNHEQAMLDFLREPERAFGWLGFGGAETLASYGVAAPPEGADDRSLITTRDALLDALPASHLTLLQRLETMTTVGDYVFVHAGLRPGVSLADQIEHDLLWIRKDFLKSQASHDLFVVHGHTWSDEHPKLLGNRLGLDTGAYSTGVLTAVRLEDGGLSFLRARARVK
jgi:serine/threonine protein phosphatase 1